MIQRILVVLLLPGMFIISCAGGGNDTVTSPSTAPDQIHSQTASNSASHHLWGYWSVSIDPETLTPEVNPLRGVQFTCNVTQFMQPPISPVHMIGLAILPGSNPPEGYFEVDVTLQHPFPGIAYYRGFDVRGILISNGSYASDHDASATYGGDGDTQLLNADGLTRWWNPTEFTSYDTIFGYSPGKLAPYTFPTATLNGYKYFADALDYDQPVWELDTDSRGTYPTVPGVYKTPYLIQFAMDGPQVDFTFNYAVDASWYEPDPAGAPDYDIEHYSLSANMQEAYCLSVVDNGSTAYYANPGDSGGELNLAIRVYDWQALINPDGVPGEIASLWLESPVLSSPVDVFPIATILPDGPTSSVFEVSLGSLNLTQSGEEPLFVFAQAADDFGYEPLVPGGANFDYPDNPLGSYLMTSVIIGTEGGYDLVVTSIDPDNGISGELLTGVLVGGQGFQSGAQVELRRDDWPTIEADNEVTTVDDLITCDLDLELAPEGDWDVVVINPDTMEGVLEDGFHVYCAEAVHEYEGKHYLTGGLIWNYCQRGDLCILETGAHEGECVLKRRYDSTADTYGYYVLFDPDNPSDTPETDYFSIPGRTDAEWAYVTMTTQIDQNPVNAHMGVVNGRMFDYVQIVDENGTHLEDIVVTDPQTIPGETPLVPAIDFDVNGDLWMITNVLGDPNLPSVPDPVWQLRHYELQESSPYYVENLADRLDITNDLPCSSSYAPIMWYLADIAISYTEDSLFVFAASIGGYNETLFVKYDISTTPPTWVMDADLIGSDARYCCNPYSGISRADIEFDHVDLSVENCRLLVMYQSYDGQTRTHLMRIDTDLNILNNEIVGPGMGSWDNPHAIAINTDPDNRNLIAIDMSSSVPRNDFFYFTMPTEGW